MYALYKARWGTKLVPMGITRRTYDDAEYYADWLRRSTNMRYVVQQENVSGLYAIYRVLRQRVWVRKSKPVTSPEKLYPDFAATPPDEKWAIREISQKN